MAGLDERQFTRILRAYRERLRDWQTIGAGNTCWSTKTKASAPARLWNMRTLS